MDGAANDELFISPSENTTTMTNDQAKWVLNLIFVKNVNRSKSSQITQTGKDKIWFQTGHRAVYYQGTRNGGIL